MSQIDKQRDARKNEIIEKARVLMCQKGIDGTQMKELAAQLDISRQTLYKYFSNTDVLAYAVEETTLAHMQKWSVNQIKDFSGTGLDLVKRGLELVVEYAEKYPYSLVFISLFDAHYNSRPPLYNLEESYNKFIAQEGKMVDAIKLGVADGSIKCDIDEKVLGALLSNVIFAIAQRNALLGQHETLFKKNIYMIIDILIDYIKA